MPEASLWYPIAVGLVVAGGGWLFGSWILGIYLLTSLAIYGRHANEAFSALRNQDYKQFLRMRIDRLGRLSIFVVGIERVARSIEGHLDESIRIAQHAVERADTGLILLVDGDAKCRLQRVREIDLDLDELRVTATVDSEVDARGCRAIGFDQHSTNLARRLE